MRLTNKILIFCIFLLFTGCSVFKRKSTEKEPNIDYRPVTSNIQPDFFIHRINDNQSRLYLQIPKQFFTAGKMEGEDSPSVSLSVDLKIIRDQNEETTDSVVFTINPTGTELVKPFITRNHEIPAVKELHRVKITLTDKAKDIAQLYFVKVPASDQLSPCVPINPQTKLPLFQYSLKQNEWFELFCKEDVPDSIQISYFSFNTNPRDRKRPDSTWFQKPVNGLFGLFENEGIYRISVDASKSGFPIRIFNKNYPSLNTPNDLWKPLAYIATKDEIENFDTTSHRKLAIDNFWLSRQRDPYKSRELISAFYGRVFWANQIFSEGVPGWKTDRGRTLILLGVPFNAISDGRTEKWFFRDQKGKRFSVEFIDNNSSSPLPDFRFSKRIPAGIEKLAIDGWNKGEPITFGQTNDDI